MKRYVTAITVAAVCAAAPMLVSAATVNDNMRASCMKAFVATLPSNASITPKLTRDYTPSAMALGTNVNEYLLTARDAKSDRLLAQAVCSIDNQGRVTLNHDPLTLAQLL